MYQAFNDPDSRLILPGDEEYELTIGSIMPFDWKYQAYKNFGEFTFVADSQSGLLRTANKKETDEYLYGGEYEERMLSIDDEQEYYD